MDKKELEKLFVFISSRVEKRYEEECSMAMDCFIEEEFDQGELERFLEYLLELVKEEQVTVVDEKIKNYLANI